MSCTFDYFRLFCIGCTHLHFWSMSYDILTLWGHFPLSIPAQRLFPFFLKTGQQETSLMLTLSLEWQNVFLLWHWDNADNGILLKLKPVKLLNMQQHFKCEAPFLRYVQLTCITTAIVQMVIEQTPSKVQFIRQPNTHLGSLTIIGLWGISLLNLFQH